MGFRVIAPKRVKKKKAKNGQEVLRRLEEYLAGSCDGLAEILCRFWEDQKNVITYQELRQAVRDGVLSQETFRLWQQDYSVLVAGKFGRIWMDGIRAGSAGQPVFDGMYGRGFVFDMQAPGILRWIRERGAEFVTNSTQEQKGALAALLTKKIRDSHTVDELARLIRPCIGLTKGDSQAVLRYYDRIVANLKNDHPRMKQESIRRKASDAAQKYAEKKHRARAMTIAMTESAFAYNQGANFSIRQAQAEGYLGVMKKRWCTSGDDNVCDLCNSLEGMELGMDDVFDIGGWELFPGHHLLPPAHPRCACAVEYIEVNPPVLRAGPSLEGEEPVEDTSAEIEYLGALENISDDVVKSTLREYEEEIVNSPTEQAVIITRDGMMWKAFGDKEQVLSMHSLGIELTGASITHNHPIGSANEYSFSQDDITFFMEKHLAILRGVDERYLYELSNRTLEVDDYATIEELIKSDGDLSRHQAVIDFARTSGVGYRRWKR